MPTKETEETKTRRPPEVFDYHGIPIYYRVEDREYGEYPTLLILSIRDKHGNIVCKCPKSPHRFPKAYRNNKEQALELLIPKFLSKYLDPNSSDGLERRKALAQKGLLSFGIVYELDMAYLRKQNHWRKNTFNRYNQQMKPLLAKWHTVPLDQLIPEECATLLEKQPYDTHHSCASLLRQIFARECKLGTYKENPWIDYTPQVRRKKAKTTENLKQAELTTEQCREILKLCVQNITAVTNGSIYLAAAFLLFLGIPLKELCSLTYADLKCTREFRDCTVIQFQEERYQREGSKQYIHMPILEGYRRRVIAIPDVLVILCTMRLATFPKVMTDEAKTQCPLIHSLKNRNAAMRPDHLHKSLQKIFGQICESSKFGGKFSVVDRFIATAKSNLRWVGFTEEEMCYHFGWTPKSTAAKSYINFADESQLNRCKRKLELWTQGLCTALPDWEKVNRKYQKRKLSDTQMFSPDPGAVCLFQGTFQPFTTEGANIPTIDFEIASTGGLSTVKVEYIKITDGKDR